MQIVCGTVVLFVLIHIMVSSNHSNIQKKFQQQLGVGVFVLLELPRMKFRVQRMFRAIFSLVVICSCYVRAHLLHLANIFVRVFVVFKHVFDNLRLVRGALGVFARLQEKSRLPRAALQSSPLSPLCSLPLF